MTLEPKSSFVSVPDCLCVSAHPISVFHHGYAFQLLLIVTCSCFIYAVEVEAEFKTSADSAVLS